MSHLDLYINFNKDKRKTCACNRHNPLCNYGIEGNCQKLKVSYNPYSCIKECMNNRDEK